MLANVKYRVIPLYYATLHDLIQHSSSSRSYFLSLPVNVQLKLHDEFDEYIHSAQELHSLVDALDQYTRQLQISSSLDPYFL